MGFYHGSSTPPEEEEPGGCKDALILTRAAFGVLLIPVAVLLGAVLSVVLLVYLFSLHWLFGLLYLGLIGAGIAWYARWEQNKYRSGPPM